MAYYQSEESSNTAKSGKMWENVVKPVMADNTGKYRKEMSEQEIKIFECVAGGTLTKLGYRLDFPESRKLIFTQEELITFDKENERLRREAKNLISPEELARRQKQEQLVAEIRARKNGQLTAQG